MMKNTAISFLDIPTIPLSIQDFLNGKWSVFQQYIFSWENFEAKIAEQSEKFTDSQRDILHQVLSEQLRYFPLTVQQKDNLDALKENTTFTVTTGHQLNLFTGSTFFIYKILQTIKTAEELKNKFPNYNFVPIFWLATEDHDFEEIRFFRTEEKKYQFDVEHGGAVGKIKMSDVDFIAEFEEDFKGYPFGEELIRLMKSAYQKGKTLTEATQEIVQYLFANRGLLFIDGDDKALKKAMIPLFKDELLNATLQQLTESKRDFLQKEYGKVQVNPREINLFYLSDTRNRIVRENGFWKVKDTEKQWRESELLDELKDYPERFSPNALMRPVFQETVLPNLAYVGGNAEINYWLELCDYFKEKDVSYPVLIPRNSMLFLASKVFHKMERLSLDMFHFLGDISSVLKERLLDNHEMLKLLSDKEADLKKQFKEIKNKATEIDVTFMNLVEAEETRQFKSFHRMKKRLLRAEKIKHQEYIQRVELLYQEIHPLGVWQERVFNFSQFYALKGASWLDSCYQMMDVSKSELKIVEF